MGVTKLISLVNLAVTIYFSSTDSRVSYVIAAVVVVIVDWFVRVMQASQLLKRNFVADIFLNKIAYDYYTMTSFLHFCFYQKVNAQLPSKCQGRISVHRSLNTSVSVLASLVITVYSTLLVFNFSTTYSLFSLILSWTLAILDAGSAVHAILYYVSNKSDFNGSLENWCLDNINKSLFVLNLLDASQQEEATTIVLYNNDHVKTYATKSLMLVLYSGQFT
ncbi:hypothetical protein HDV01_000923 [Terramyces sp. JEL0728]|nr:hypothetical protein HDV01_000923 [Terramyces sp. JEL0728]